MRKIAMNSEKEGKRNYKIKGIKNMKVQVCTGKMCSERFSSYIIDRLEKDKDFYNLKELEISSCMCTGNCKIGPAVIFDGKIETHMNPIKASDIARGKAQIQKGKNNKGKKYENKTSQKPKNNSNKK